MVEIAQIFGADRKRAERELKESLEFEIKLANVSPIRDKSLTCNFKKNPFNLRSH